MPSFYVELFPNLEWNDAVRPRENSQIAWAVQKDTPQLLEHLNAFVKTHKKGTHIGNVLINRYFRNPDWVERIEPGCRLP